MTKDLTDLIRTHTPAPPVIPPDPVKVLNDQIAAAKAALADIQSKIPAAEADREASRVESLRLHALYATAFSKATLHPEYHQLISDEATQQTRIANLERQLEQHK